MLMQNPQDSSDTATYGGDRGTNQAAVPTVTKPRRTVEMHRPDDAQLTPPRPTWTDLVSMAVITVAITLMAIIPMLTNRHFYYFDDTAGGAYGQWFELGQQLSHGHLPLLNLNAWMAGNYAVEQFGLANPIIWLIGLGSQVVPDAPIYASFVKWFFLVVAGLGTYLLAHNLGARRDFAVLAGIAAPLGGFTLFFDSTTWVTNLEVWAYFPWVMWGLLRFVHQHRSYWPAFIPGFLIITVNYVQGAIMLVLLFVALIVDAAVRRKGRALLRTIFAGVPFGLLVMAIFLPAILTSNVSVRDQGVTNSGFMTLTLNGLAVSSSPFASPDTSNFDGTRYALAPYTYIAWFLPVLLLCQWSRVRALAGRLLLPFFLLLLATTLAIGPSQMGPLRFPMRSMPWVVLLTVTLTAVLFSRCLEPRNFTGRKLAVTLVVVGFVLWLSFSARPSTGWWQVIPAALMMCYVIALWATGRRAASKHHGKQWLTAIAVSMIVLTLATSGIQLNRFAVDSESSFGQKNMPANVTAMEQPIQGAVGETILLGSGPSVGPKVWSVARYGNLAYLSKTAIINLYTPVGYQAMSNTLCMQPYYGITCYDAATRLFNPVVQAGGTSLVDLMSLDTVQFVAPNTRELDTLMAEHPVPKGWTLSNVTDISFIWRRDAGVEPVGLPTWASTGVQYHVITNTDTEVKIHLDSVPAEGGQIAFSRLSWPGYRIRNGTLTDPILGFLLHVDVPASSAGQDLVMSFRPPGWLLEVGSFTLAWVLALGYAVVRTIARRRAHTKSSAAKA